VNVSEVDFEYRLMNSGNRCLGDAMASSLSFCRSVKDIIPTEVLERFNILPLSVKKGKLCLIARRPLSDSALIELKKLTGYEDYELQLVGEDVLVEYIERFKLGTIFSSL
jgi:hypothetical protein